MSRVHITINENRWNAEGRYLRYAHGWRRDRGHMVHVERWGDGDWQDVSRSAERIWPAPRKILPPMTEVEMDAWADLAAYYVTAGTTTADLASILPGWDDVTTFEPFRTPTGSRERLFSDYGVGARFRAIALAGMALRRLARQGRASRSGDQWGPA